MKKIFTSKIWFLISTLIFAIAGERYIVKGDNIEAIINFLVAITFFIGFVFQIKFYKPKK